MEESDEVLKWRLTTNKNIGERRARTESLKWLRLGEEEGESIYARTYNPGLWIKPGL
jgi:hypothetical protein